MTADRRCLPTSIVRVETMPIPVFTSSATIGNIGSAMTMHCVQWAGDCDRLTGRPPLQSGQKGAALHTQGEGSHGRVRDRRVFKGQNGSGLDRRPTSVQLAAGCQLPLVPIARRGRTTGGGYRAGLGLPSARLAFLRGTGEGKNGRRPGVRTGESVGARCRVASGAPTPPVMQDQPHNGCRRAICWETVDAKIAIHFVTQSA